jgi:predicted HicB family RNase H-like nuclease
MKKTTTTKTYKAVTITAATHAKIKKLAKKNKTSVRQWAEKAIKAYKPTN